MVENAGSTTPITIMDLASLKEIGIGLGALCIIALVVKYFLQAMKDSREDFCKLMSNHIEHNTIAIEKLDETLQKNTEVLSKISSKIK